MFEWLKNLFRRANRGPILPISQSPPAAPGNTSSNAGLSNGLAGFDDDTKARFCNKLNFSKESALNIISYFVPKLTAAAGNVFMGSSVQVVTGLIGSATYLTNIAQDVAAVREAELELQAIEENLIHTIPNMKISLVSTDPGGIFFAQNAGQVFNRVDAINQLNKNGNLAIMLADNAEKFVIQRPKQYLQASTSTAIAAAFSCAAFILWLTYYIRLLEPTPDYPQVGTNPQITAYWEQVAIPAAIASVPFVEIANAMEKMFYSRRETLYYCTRTLLSSYKTEDVHLIPEEFMSFACTTFLTTERAIKNYQLAQTIQRQYDEIMKGEKQKIVEQLDASNNDNAKLRDGIAELVNIKENLLHDKLAMGRKMSSFYEKMECESNQIVALQQQIYWLRTNYEQQKEELLARISSLEVELQQTRAQSLVFNSANKQPSEPEQSISSVPVPLEYDPSGREV